MLTTSRSRARGYRHITLIKLCFDFALALPGAGKHADRDIRFGLFGSVGPLVNQLGYLVCFFTFRVAVQN